MRTLFTILLALASLTGCSGGSVAVTATPRPIEKIQVAVFVEGALASQVVTMENGNIINTVVREETVRGLVVQNARVHLDRDVVSEELGRRLYSQGQVVEVRTIGTQFGSPQIFDRVELVCWYNEIAEVGGRIINRELSSCDVIGLDSDQR